MTETILLVEDSDDNRAIYRTVLEHSGYAVVEAVDGEACLQAAREHLPALILMDISIPKVDGWEATRILKQDPNTAAIPVIALTAHAFSEDRRRAEALGFDGYLAKPIEPRQVVAEVARILGAPAGGPSPADA
jgi:two-component system cell cycle response regulator DivK